MHSLLLYLVPWEFSPTVLFVCAGSGLLYARGLIVLRRAGAGVGIARPLAFFLGLALMYGVMQTYFDYLSQHMFWVHRLQHLVLHHVAPFLLVLAAPAGVMLCGLPPAVRARISRLSSRMQWLWRGFHWIQNPIVAPLLFVGLIYFWLTPSIHFTAMLNAERYRAMNWGMAIDGILFWWLMLTPRSTHGAAALSYAWRLLILFIVTLLQILLGAHITFEKSVLFDVYAICGRAWAISPLEDQQLGGLLTWIPPAMMSTVAVLLVLRRLLMESEAGAARAVEAERLQLATQSRRLMSGPAASAK